METLVVITVLCYLAAPSVANSVFPLFYTNKGLGHWLFSKWS